MKKIIYIMLIIIVLSFYVNNSNSSIIIPDNSIRFRIIANSNEAKDQALKMDIKNELSNNIFKLLENSSSVEETRKIIKENEDIIKLTLDKYNVNYSINYGNNYFPEKEYNGVTYDAGEYESLVITLGEAKGNNWWCVMYPPLCLLESNSNKYEETEYKLYIKEILSKLSVNNS